MTARCPAPLVCTSGRLRVACAAGLAALGIAAGTPASAQQDWNPFGDQTQPSAQSRRTSRPVEERVFAPEPRGGGFSEDAPDRSSSGVDATQDVGGGTVEKVDLAPLSSPEGPAPGAQSAGPISGQRGAVAATGEGDASNVPILTRLSKEMVLPVRSQAVGGLLERVVGGRGIAGPETPESIGLRVTLLYRAGLVSAAEALLSEASPGYDVSTPAGAALAALKIRVALAAGDRERVCAGAAALLPSRVELPASIRGAGIVAQGYCGAASGNPGAAGLAASLAREAGGVPESMLAALDAVASGEAPALKAAQRIDALDWRLAEVSGRLETAGIAPDRLEPAALYGAALSGSAPARLRIAAAEAAARFSLIDASHLADAYRQFNPSGADLDQPLSARVEPWARRALLFKAAETERTPLKRARLIRAGLDDARRAGLYPQFAAALARPVEEIRPVPEIGWFAETAVEVMISAGRFDAARRWIDFGSQPAVTGDRNSQSLAHWHAFIDIADPSRSGAQGHGLAAVEELALRGRFSADGLHRLATVLDALDFEVPVRLWDAASRAPQPTTGHLPATGVLSELQDAAKRKELLRTAGLVMQTLGPGGPEGAHMIALGDSIRALRRAGLVAEARQMAAEALFALWPRVSNS